jgi:8-oxo-dGTP diphosphatase
MKEHISPNLTVDCVVFYKDKVLLITRKNDPYKGRLAFPGGFIEPYEHHCAAVRRELYEETGLKLHPRLIDIYGQKGRDPRGWTVTFAFWADILDIKGLRAGDDAKKAKFYNIDEILKKKLAFDHNTILSAALYCRHWYDTYQR